MAHSELVPLVRLNISDMGDDPALSDEDIELLLKTFDGSANRASARALRIIAASEVMVSKVIQTQDLRTDGRAVAEALRGLAQDFDAEAEAEEAAQGGSMRLVPFGGSRRAEGQEYRAGGVY